MNDLTKSQVKNICFCADIHYLQFIPAAIESILRSQRKPDQFNFHIITNVEKDSAATIRFSHLPLSHDKLFWHNISGAEYADLKEVTHITKGMYYRLSIPKLIQSDKVLYLDCDVLVRKDISALFDIDITTYYAAAVTNPFPISEEDWPHGYFNSGVLLINTQRWLQDNISEHVVNLARSKPETLVMPDQDALNHLFQGNWLRLPPEYNAQMSMFTKPKKLLQEGAEFKNVTFLEDPAIVHFSSSNKQWHLSSCLRFTSEYRALSTSLTIAKRTKPIDYIIGRSKGAIQRLIKRNPYFSF